MKEVDDLSIPEEEDPVTAIVIWGWIIIMTLSIILIIMCWR